jgi:hypothetical protein
VKRFELAAGTHTVKVAFSRKARAALKKAGAVRLVVAPAGGAKTTLVVRLR